MSGEGGAGRVGELVQWDTSEHDWLEGRGPKLYLISLIDDASSRLMARFVEHDSTAENMRLLQSYLERLFLAELVSTIARPRFTSQNLFCIKTRPSK